jgi:hypothetical protein
MELNKKHTLCYSATSVEYFNIAAIYGYPCSTSFLSRQEPQPRLLTLFHEAFFVSAIATAGCMAMEAPGPPAFFSITIQILLDKVIDGLYDNLENSVLVTDISG